ncbi:MAG: sigma-70 family RNA polymerase sigma factor [Akkermansiaceae bacterium]|nr:sigma-70 family RNA polymerase sigma factor [Akkermansiaceae bacterium]
MNEVLQSDGKIFPSSSSNDRDTRSCDTLMSQADAELFSKKLVQLRPALRGYLRTMLKSHEGVEDCIQEASITIWNRYEASWDNLDFRRYAFTCARFKALSWLKKHNSQSVVFADEEVAENIASRVLNNALNKVNESEDRLEALDECVKSLPDKQQKVLNARYHKNHREKLSYLAAESSRSMDSVYKQLERLRTTLKRCVEDKMENKKS